MKLQEDLYVCFGERDAERPMLPASIASQGGGRYVLRVGVDVEAAIGTPVVLYRHIQQRFFSQRGVVESVCYVSPRETLVKVSCEPEPTPAEKRTAYRAVTAARDLTAYIGGEKGCPVVNVSASGLAAIVANPPPISSTVEIVMMIDRRRVAGRGIIRSRTRMGRNRYRCGIEVPDAGLARALSELCMAVQREQLRRLARL